MNAHLLREETRVSDMPRSGEGVSGFTTMSPRVAPAVWLQKLQQAAVEAPHEQGVGAVALHLFQALTEFLPELSFGLMCEPPEQPRIVLRFPPGEPRDGQLFPELSWEHAEPIPVPWPAEVRIASTGDLPPGDSAELLLLRSLAQVLALGLRLAIASAQAQEGVEAKRQLAQADKLAAVGRLAASTLHELNNPLTTILAYTEYLRRKVERVPLEAEDIERLRRIYEAAERVQRLTRNLVDYARPSGRVPVMFRLHDVLEQALAFCEHPLSEKGAVVEREYGEGDDLVLGNPGELTQVFVNLIINACHAMPRGSGRLYLRSELSKEQIVVYLRDNGHGIAPEHAPHIFEPFYTTKALGSGTGLGLSIVRTLLEHHQGTISFRNPPGAGAEFIVSLARRRGLVPGANPALKLTAGHRLCVIKPLSCRTTEGTEEL
ncbi:MAG: ATP-binding protein [Myxococcales bacterium]|nr:ATP-binding protein [Polyangiaceae bacterium]MDW8248402.1 ATP-binding protein [Myxococcales bacterium]